LLLSFSDAGFFFLIGQFVLERDVFRLLGEVLLSSGLSPVDLWTVGGRKLSFRK
jgi:hypothetical protein